MSRSHWKWIVAALAVTGPLGFAAFTGHMWEDYFITLRSSRNLVEGHGLVFTPGERVHTFTSPLGVLLPALCSALAGPEREVLSLWLFRVLSVGFLAAAALLTWRRFDDLRVGAIGRVAFFGLVLADAKLTDFSINGMETAILVFFVLSLWAELERSAGPRIGPLALACAGLMWTRPDGCIPAAVLVVSHLLFRGRNGGAKPVSWRPLLLGIGVSILIYLPWFLWAWWYYGSPIPHTIIAKSGVTPPVRLADFALIPWSTLRGLTMFPDLFLPTYWSHGGWPPGLRYFGYGLSLLGAFAWVVPPLPGPLRRASFALFLGMFYVCTIILFPWYSPPWMVLAALVVAFTLDHFASRATAGNVAWLASTVRIGTALIVAVQATLLVATAWQMRVQQRVIEHGVRQSIGEWLRAHAKPTDSVLMEPLGYIGYYSRLKTYDFPGLSSPEVVQVIRSGVRRYADLIATLRPTWLVLRPSEVAADDFAQRPVLRDYHLVKSWNALPELDAVPYLPGRKWVEWDARFHVYQYRPAADAAAR